MKLPPYSIFPNISNDKILLRQIHKSDISDLLEISFYNGVQARSIQEATEMQSKIDRDYMEGNSMHWGIVNKLTNTIVGTCGYYRGFEKGAGELGCVLLSHFRGQGLMVPAMSLAIDFGLKIIGLNKIWAVTKKQNVAAIKLLERLNFKKFADLDEDEIEYELR